MHSSRLSVLTLVAALALSFCGCAPTATVEDPSERPETSAPPKASPPPELLQAPQTPADQTPADQTPADRAADDWTPPLLPKRRYAAGFHRIGDSIYVFGGKTGGRAEENRYAYRIDRGETEWRQIASIPDRHDYRGSVVIDDRIYTVGPAILQYNPTVDRWIPIKVNIPIPRSHFYAAALGREIYQVGGLPRNLGVMKIFSLDDDSLRAGPNLPEFRGGDHFIILATLDGSIHAIGGIGHGSREIEKQHFRLVNGVWETRAPHPTGVTGKFTAWTVHEGRLFTFEREGFVYDPETDTWTALATPPRMRVLPALIPLDDTLVMLGGLEPQEQKNEGWKYFVSEDRWEQILPPESE